MDRAQAFAREALRATVETFEGRGLTAALQSLVQDVYAGNLDRHEPDELGDTAMSLCVQCYENLKTRSIRRYLHDDREPVDAHWDVDGLRVWTPKNVLTFSLGGVRVVTMKVPFTQGRTPDWNWSGDWDQDGQNRLKIATENSRVLQYRTAAVGASPLFPHPGSPSAVQNYMLLWAGEPDAPLTAGWLGVPILGETPFIAREKLWWDDEPRARVTTHSTSDRGPSFDQRPAVMPAVTLKESNQEGQA